MRLQVTVALIAHLSLPLTASPTGTNLGFEEGLSGWNSANVAARSGSSPEGIQHLDLQSGFIEQTLTGLTPGQPHSLSLAYLSQSGFSYILSGARLSIDGAMIGELHTSQSSEYLACNGFEFIPNSTSASLRIESLETSNPGLLIDDIRITLGGRPSPPAQSWSNLDVLPGGDRQLVNGGFEAAIGNPSTDPNNSGPVGNEHLCGTSLPGWLVTRENVDVIQYSNANPPEGTNALDTSGHGPGGIAQTITGLTPGGAYTLSFKYARHVSWGTEDMTGQAFVNGVVKRSLVRTVDQTWEDGYDTVEIPSIASQSGTLTIEVISTITDKGGCIVYDDFRIAEGAELFNEWALAHGATPDPTANDDLDSFLNGFEFLFGLDPKNPEESFAPLNDSGNQILPIPISGAALSQGYQLQLLTSSDLDQWISASDENSGLSFLSDSSSKGIHGTRRYLISPTKSQLFWRYQLSSP
ncbi:hypothetical protein [Haloferula sp.]|uniref:hypothetical protein n=1 Tax=Haloferula sp. TaxID=2497595 RepID=UPI003C761990